MMAYREVLLRMTPAEERALSRLIGFLCNEEDHKHLELILGRHDPAIEALGQINGALNACR